MQLSRIGALLCASALALAAQDQAGDLRARARAALSQTAGELAIAGLEQPVEVIRDRWGIPHIYAKTVHDLFFAQGFVAAQDRLWQIDVWRRVAEGKLSELVGPSGVTRDTFARLLGYRGDMDAEWRSYRPDARAIVEAFVAGVNAEIGVAISSPDRLPIEFQLTNSRPEPWTPEVVIGRMAGYIMTRNARTEVQRARLARTGGLTRLAESAALDPPTAISIPDGLDLADITDEVLALTAGAGESVDFSPLRALPGGAQSSASGPQSFPLSPPSWLVREVSRSSALSPQCFDDPPIGSNDWVVSGRLSATGKPLLANDPHRPILLPSLRYTVHLNGPGWNVIGAGEPALPGVAAGHNDRIAFGFTIVGIDQQDLYVEQLDPADPDRYLFEGRSEPMRIERERIAVRGEAPREVTLRFTRHGPVLHRDTTRGRAYALRWVGSEPGAAGYLKSLALDTAGSWPEFLQALDGWKVPSENLVYADVGGNIGWVAAGAAPIRSNWSGLLPVPGHEGKYEWQGFLKVADLPQLFNPASGFVATANHNILPPRYRKTLGYEFSAPYRFTRILEVLDGARRAGRKLSVADFERLQHDELSVVARAIVSALKRALERPGAVPAGPAPAAGAPSPAAVHPAAQPDQDSRRAAALLASWDAVVARDSAAAALFEIWLPLVTRAVGAAVTPPPTSEQTNAGRPGAERTTTSQLLGVLEAAGLLASPVASAAWVDGSPRENHAGRTRPASLPAGTAARVASALTGPALGAAWREAATRMGADRADWVWGRIHRAAFQHALAFTPARQAVLNLADVPRGGDGTTPNATGSGALQTSGASYRQVIDLSDWDRSTTINVPGISGQAGSAHYGDLLPLWAAGQYHPMAFSRQAVDRVAESRLTLVPR